MQSRRYRPWATWGALALPALALADQAQILPTVYEAGHFYAVPETPDGNRLKLLVDTGGGGRGGMYWITAAAAKRLHLARSACTLGDGHVDVAALPAYRPDRALPPPMPGPCGKAVLVNPDYDVDGQLGAGYLPGRIWTFDYPARRLSLESSHWHPDPGTHQTPLGFPHDAKGQAASGFARITIRVDGQPLDMLLDTGATAYPTPIAARLSDTPTVHGEGVASYITTGMLERWHKAHPDWRVLENADDKVAAKPLKRIIEVPRVEIAGWTVGPVWFTEQPDRTYHVWMAGMMDKAVEGTVGGNVFRHFAMTLDYPRAEAWFRCIEGCRAATPPPAP